MRHKDETPHRVPVFSIAPALGRKWSATGCENWECHCAGRLVTAFGKFEPISPAIGSRVFFCFAQGQLIALHGFIKKGQKTPDDELELARKRQREFKKGVKDDR